MQIYEFQDSQTEDVVALWQRCGLNPALERSLEGYLA